MKMFCYIIEKEDVMKRITVLTALLLVVLVPFVALAEGGKEKAASGEKPIEIKLGHGHTATHSYQVGGMEKTAEILSQKTNGRMTMKFFPSAQLGNERQMQEALSAGTLEMTITGLVNLYDPAFALFDFPYLYTNRDQVKAVMYSDLMQDMNKGLIAKGMRILGLMEVGFRNVTSNKPIRVPRDLQGFKIRTPESPAQIQTFKALGAIPTPMSFNELYTALQQGVVDGQENPLENIYNGKLYEVQDYVNVTRHIYNFAYVLVSEKFWQSLSAADQQTLADAVKTGSLAQIDFAAAKEADYRKMLEQEGMQFIEPDLSAFRKGAAEAYNSQFVKDLGPRGQQIIEQIRKIVAAVK